MRDYSIYYAKEQGRRLPCFCFDSVSSTNDVAKTLLHRGKCGEDAFAVLAAEQCSGRGRMGRTFVSPRGKGIYMTLVRKAGNVADVSPAGCFSALAVCDLLGQVFGLDCTLKWPNDVLAGGKKICGILTESSLSSDGGSFDYVIVGIGVNLVAVFSGTEVENIAGGIYGKNSVPPDICKVKNRLTAEIVNNLVRLCPGGTVRKTKSFVKKYRSKLFIIGKNVTVLRGSEEYEAKVTGLSDDLSLITERKNGEKEILYSGEVRIKL